jgi:hypothetical protein
MPNSIKDPNDDLQQYIQQWQQAQAQYNQDYAYLGQMIQQMIDLAKQGGSGVEEAFQIGQMCVMPGAMTVQGDSMGELGATMNVGSACQEFTTETQNDINNGAKMTPAQAKEFIERLEQLYDAVKEELALPKNQQWMDPNTANNIIDAMNKIAGEFEPGATPDTLYALSDYYAGVISGDINQWTSNPTQLSQGVDGNAASATGQQHIQNIQAAFQQWTNTQSAQSQSLTAQEQFNANTFNQYMNACETVFSSMQKQYQNFVQNQKAQ